MNARRKLIFAGAALHALAWTKVTIAQTKQPALIGWLNLGTRDLDSHVLAAFKEGLASFGLKEGAQIVIDERWANGQYDRLKPLAEELAAKNPTLIVAAPLPAALAASKAAPSTPIVISQGGDPVAGGLVKSLARPGGMITGVTTYRAGVAEKYLELLIESVPKLRRVGFLADPRGTSYANEIGAAKRSIARYAVEAHFSDAASPNEIDVALSRFAKLGVQGVIVLSGGVLSIERGRIVKFALANQWPVITGNSEYAYAGGLLSYGADSSWLYRRAAYYVDRILKGAKPAELPVEQPAKFEMIVNLKTARALGINLPQTVMVRAEKVIE